VTLAQASRVGPETYSIYRDRRVTATLVFDSSTWLNPDASQNGSAWRLIG
jgi:hypothetical protein